MNKYVPQFVTYTCINNGPVGKRHTKTQNTSPLKTARSFRTTIKIKTKKIEPIPRLHVLRQKPHFFVFAVLLNFFSGKI